MNVTLDVFSALIDSRAGASPVVDLIAAREHWPLAGEELFGAWDRQHKRRSSSVGGGSRSAHWAAGSWPR